MYDSYTDIASIAQLQSCMRKRKGMWTTVVINMRVFSKLKVQFMQFRAAIHRLQSISAQTGVFITTMGTTMWKIHFNIETLQYQLLHALWQLKFLCHCCYRRAARSRQLSKCGAGLNLCCTLLRESLSTFLYNRRMKSDIIHICATGIVQQCIAHAHNYPLIPPTYTRRHFVACKW